MKAYEYKFSYAMYLFVYLVVWVGVQGAHKAYTESLSASLFDPASNNIPPCAWITAVIPFSEFPCQDRNVNNIIISNDHRAYFFTLAIHYWTVI